MTEILQAILLVLLFAFYDFYILNIKGKYIDNHNSRWLLRALCILLLSEPIIQNDYIYFNYYKIIGFSLFFASTFDNTLNVLRFGNKKLFYLGKKADWDKFWNKRKKVYIVFIVISFIFSLWTLNHKY